MKKISLILLVLVVLAIGAAWFFMRIGATNHAAYDALETEIDAYIDATFLPGALNNPVRNELNRMLGESLSEVFSDAERLERARRGLALIDELEAQIDAIGSTKDSLEARFVALESESPYTPSFLFRGREEARSLTERLYVIADDIRGLSYRANYHTAQIFERIISEGGTLSAGHIQSLNERIPQVEEQFDERSNLYAELESVESELDVLFAGLRRDSSQ